VKLVVIIMRNVKSLFLLQNFIQISSFKVNFNVIAQYAENCEMGSVIIIVIIITAIEFSLCGSSPYTIQAKQMRINVHKRNNTKHSKYKFTYYQNTPTYTHPHIVKQVNTITVQDTHQTK